MNAAAVVHDGAHQAALGADQRVVQPGRNGHLHLLNVGLGGTGGESEQEPANAAAAAAAPPISCERGLTSSLWMPRIRSLAASQLTFLPVMTIISELLFSVGKSILVVVSSRICGHTQPFNMAEDELKLAHKS